ncbi:MAG: nucleotidyltransferase family protein [Alphaproteobacteria bacterium]
MSIFPPIKQAMVMAAGYGMRLRPLTDKTPKALLSIEGRPILAYTLEQLQQAGIDKIVINTHHLATKVHDYLTEFPSVIISHEDILLGSGGGILKALPHFQEQPFIIINADTHWKGAAKTAIDHLRELWDESRMDALLLLMPRSAQAGDYFLEPTGRLIYRGSQDTAPYIYTGLAILHPRIFEGVSAGTFSIVDVCFHKAQSSGRLYGHVHQGFWADIGTPESLQALQMI